METDAIAHRLLGTILKTPTLAALAVQTVGDRYWLEPWPSSETREIARCVQTYTRRGEYPSLDYLREDFAEHPAILALLDDLPNHAEADHMVPQTARRLKAEALRVRAKLAADTIHRQFLDPAADPIALASNAIVALSEFASAGGNYPSSAEMAETLIQDYDAMKSGNRPQGFRFYHPTMEHLLGGGLPYGEMFVLGARPSHGKTSFLGNIIVRALRQKHPVVFFSMDDSYELAQKRLACIYASISLSHALHGRLLPATEQRYFAALRWLGRSPLLIVPDKELTPLQCRAILQTSMLTRFPGQKPLAAMDFLQKQRADRTDDDDDHDSRGKVTANARAWKSTAADLGVPAIVLAQLNRESQKGGGRRPRLEDLKESGAIEEEAYAVGLLDYPYRYDRNAPANSADLWLDKNKGGAIGHARYLFSGYDLRFVPWRDDIDVELSGQEMADEQRRLLSSQTTDPPPEQDEI